MTVLLTILSSPAFVSVLISLIGSGILWLLKLIKDEHSKSLAEKIFTGGLPLAIQAFKAVAATTPNKLDDAAAAGLEQLEDWFDAHGMDVSTAHTAKAVQVFNGLVEEGKK